MLKGLQTLQAKLIISYLLGIVIVSAVLYSFIWLDGKQEETARISDFVKNIKLETKEVSIHEKDFFSIDIFNSYFYRTKKSPNLTLHDERLRQLKSSLGELAKLDELQADSVQLRINLLIREIGEFELKFLFVVDQIFDRGFQDFGRTGQMLECIRHIEDSHANLDIRNILMARRMEKDFFLRLDDAYIDKLEELVEDIRSDATRNTSGRQKQDLLESLDCYLTQFGWIVSTDQELGLHKRNGKRGELASSWEQILGQIDALGIIIEHQSAKQEAVVDATNWYLFLSFITLNIISLILLYWQLGRPLRRLSSSIHQVVDSDFASGVEVLKWRSKDEIGQVSGDVRKMLDKVHEKTQEADRQKQRLRSNFKKLELLSKLGKQVTSKLQVRDIVEFTYENINKLLDAPVFAIGKIEGDHSVLDYWYIEASGGGFDINKLLDSGDSLPGEDAQHIVEHGRQKLDDPTSLSALCFTRQTKVLVNDLEKEYDRYLDDVNLLHETNKRHSLIFLPLVLEGKSIGVITAQSYQRNAYPDHHVNILETIATYVAVALANAENFERIESQAEEIQASEEELRQNHEELQSINDKLEEAGAKTIQKNKELSNLVDQLNKSKEIIEKKNMDITASINYAQRIQEAILPQMTTIKESFGESFLLFQPRDIVSGDFYWYSVIGDKAIIIAADCTGHGVPGALMSVIGYSTLNEIIKQNGILEPDIILNELHEDIRELLRQDKTRNRDGMDISICAVDLKPTEDGKRYIHFAGAKNSLYYAKQGDEALTHIKGDIVPIGGFQKEEARIFTKHLVEIDRPLTFYIFSDGYQDQFGGAEGKKFMAKRLRALLFEIHSMPVAEQHLTLLQNINQWMGKKYPQLDDMLMFGAKID